MNILMITVRADFGGGPEHVYQLMNILSAQDNVKLFIAAPNEPPYWENFVKMTGKRHSIEIPHRKFTITALLKISRFIRENKITVVHSHGKGAGVYSRILKVLCPSIKVIHTLHGYHVGQYSPFVKFLYNWVEYFLSSLTERIINVSESEKKIYTSSTKVPEKLCTVIVNGVKPPSIKKIKKEEKSVFRICYIGRSAPQKNIKELVSIVREYRKQYVDDQLEVDVYGDVLADTDFSESCKENNIKIIGPVYDIKEQLHEYDALLNTSRWEGLPISILEAMISRVPVIATNVVGNNSIITDGENGFLYSLGDISAAVQSLHNVCHDNVSDLVDAAEKKVVMHFSSKNMAFQTLGLYRDSL